MHSGREDKLSKFILDSGIHAPSPEELQAVATQRQQWSTFISTFPAGEEHLDGLTLKGLRESLGMNEAELGATIGLDAETVRSAEAGREVHAFTAPLKRFVAAAQAALKTRTE